MPQSDIRVEELEEEVRVLERRLARALAEKNRRNDEQALKWRNSAFYYKKRLKLLESRLAQGGKL